MKALFQEFWLEEDGLQTVELVLILIVMAGLVFTLKTNAKTWLDNISTKVDDLIAKF